MRGDGPVIFAQVTNGIGVAEIVRELATTWARAVGPARADGRAG
jgi:hypothetical protein